jgi:hypothetical protein
MILSWGKPKVEIVLTPDGAVPAVPVWIEMKTIVEKTANLTTEKGEKVEAKGAGGELVDSKYGKNKYKFELELFVKKGDEKPVVDADGVIAGKYCCRLTPEDDTTEGWIMDNTTMTVEETWSEDIGKKWKYTFDGLKPAAGNILKPYTKP